MMVVLFHFQVETFRQGYAGVDGFFVISGFVITGILVIEMLNTKTISWARFYSRRTIRLLPASLVVLVVTCVVYSMAAAPELIQTHRWAFIAGASYWENWFLIDQAQNYFAFNAGGSPVMHFWSLSVEEQFYMVWPLTCWLTFLLFRGRLLWMAGLLLPIIGGLLWIQTTDQWLSDAQSYFATQFRLYQMLSGAAVCLIHLSLQHDASRTPNKSTEASVWGPAGVGHVLSSVGFVGMLLLSTSLWSMTADQVGWLSTILMLMLIVGLESTRTSWVSTLLCTPPMQFLGKHSYAIYLWHYPIIRIGALYGVVDQTPLNIACWCVAIVALSWITWRLVELPAKKASAWSPRVTLIVGIFASLFVILLMWNVVQEASVRLPGDSDGEYRVTASPSPWKSMYTSGASVPVAQSTSSPSPSRAVVQVAKIDGATALPPLSFQPHNRHFYLVGDSFAEEWASVFTRIGERYNITTHVRTRDGCVWFPVQVANRDCAVMLEPLTTGDEDDPWPSVVILITRSAEYNRIRRLNSTNDQDWLSMRSNEDTFLEYAQEAMIRYLDSFPDTTRFVFFHAHRSPIGPGKECFKLANPKGCVAEAGYNGPLDDFRELLDNVTRVRDDTYAFNIDHFVCPHKECHGEVDGLIQFKGDANHLNHDFVAAHEAQFEQLLYPLFPQP